MEPSQMPEAVRQPFLSVIIPSYNEEQTIQEMYSRLTRILEQNNIDFEIVMVNDGSTDDTLNLAKKICHNDNRVKLISFSRNFGHEIATTAGVDRAQGQAIVIIDADLQDPPEVIIEMIRKWKEGYKVVYGKRKRRKGEKIFKLATAGLFYRVLRKLTEIDIPTDTGDFRLMDKRVVQTLSKMRETNRFIRGMVSWIGFKQCAVEYVREERFAGETKYTLNRMIRLAFDAIASFSEVPLRISSAFGLLCSSISFFFMVYGIVVKYFFPEQAVRGWASIFVAVLFIGGVQLICIGILGEYLGRIYEEIKKRPLYVVEEEVNFE